MDSAWYAGGYPLPFLADLTVYPSLQNALQWCRASCLTSRRNHLTSGLLAAFQVMLLLLAFAAMINQVFRPGPWYGRAALSVVGSTFLFQILWSVRNYIRAPNVRSFATNIERQTPAFQASLVTSVE